MTLDTRSFIESAWPADAQNAPGVRRWRAASRVVLAILLGYSALQYYFLDVQLRILAMPGVIVFASQASGGFSWKAPQRSRRASRNCYLF